MGHPPGKYGGSVVFMFFRCQAQYAANAMQNNATVNILDRVNTKLENVLRFYVDAMDGPFWRMWYTLYNMRNACASFWQILAARGVRGISNQKHILIVLYIS